MHTEEPQPYPLNEDHPLPSPLPPQREERPSPPHQPLREVEDPDSEEAYRRRLYRALFASVAINLLLLVVFGISFSIRAHELSAKKAEWLKKNQSPQLVVIHRHPDVPAKLPPAKKRVFLETDASQTSKVRPSDADFYSEHNTLATQTRSSPVKSADIPLADGKNTRTKATETVMANPTPTSPPPGHSGETPTPTPRPNPPPSPPTPSPNKNLALRSDEMALLRQTAAQKILSEQNQNRQPQPEEPASPGSPRAPPQLNASSPPTPSRQVPASQSKLEGGVPRVGKALAFNSAESPFASYDKKIITKIGAYWQYQVVDKFYGAKIGEVEITFRLMSDGRITDLEITRNTANSVLAGWCIQAIEHSAPFDPFPISMRTMVGDSREGSITFAY